MRYESVQIAAVAHALPEEVTTSEELEQRIAPLYERLSVSPGRLELMSGIRERRFWPVGTRPSAAAARAGELALERCGLERARIGLLIHGAVSRDFLEPATASVVHDKLGLSPECMAYDLSNACLGFANGMMVAAEAIERGSLEAALVVAGEDGRPLVDATLAQLAKDPGVRRSDLKRAFASLTIGSGAAAMVLCRAGLTDAKPRLVAGVSLADTSAVGLCQGDRAPGGEGLLMETDSEALLHAGNALAARTFERFLTETEWTRDAIQRVITHQVGSAHKKLLFETLELDPARDFPTVETLGNIGSVSLPLTFSMAREAGVVQSGERVAMLGIGSGLQSAMLAVEA